MSLATPTELVRPQAWFQRYWARSPGSNPVLPFGFDPRGLYSWAAPWGQTVSRFLRNVPERFQKSESGPCRFQDVSVVYRFLSLRRRQQQVGTRPANLGNLAF